MSLTFLQIFFLLHFSNRQKYICVHQIKIEFSIFSVVQIYLIKPHLDLCSRTGNHIQVVLKVYEVPVCKMIIWKTGLSAVTVYCVCQTPKELCALHLEIKQNTSLNNILRCDFCYSAISGWVVSPKLGKNFSGFIYFISCNAKSMNSL